MHTHCGQFPTFLKAHEEIYIRAQNTKSTKYYQFSLYKATTV